MRPFKKWQWTWKFYIWSFQKLYKKTDILLLHDYWWGNWINRIQNVIFCPNTKCYIDKTFLVQCTFILMNILPLLVKYLKSLEPILMPMATLIQPSHFQVKLWNVKFPPSGYEVNKSSRTTAFKTYKYIQDEIKEEWKFWFTPIKWAYLLYVIYCWKPSTWCANYWRKDKINDVKKGTKKVYGLSSQKYEQDMTVPYKKKKNNYWKTR